MEMDIHFVREKVVSQALSVHHVAAMDQLADTLTKPISSSQFAIQRSKLNVCSFSPQP